MDSSKAGPSGSRHSLQGTKEAKASRRHPHSQAQPASIPSPQPIPPNVDMLFGYLQTALQDDTSRMNPKQQVAHGQMIEAL